MTTIPGAALTPSSTSANIETTLRQLVKESAEHRAVHHPWLRAFATLDLPNSLYAMRSYAVEYHGYAAWFPRYLKCVIDRLDNPELRQLLVHNLEEERGDLHEEDCELLTKIGIKVDDVRGVPHPTLYRRFCTALGIGDEELAKPTPAAAAWRSHFLRYLEGATPAEAVGALGLGTESVVRPIYNYLLEGIRKLNVVSREDYVFFELHCLVDDQHQEDLLTCARELLKQPGAAEELRNGMLKALDLRQQFWNHLYRNSMSVSRRGIA